MSIAATVAENTIANDISASIENVTGSEATAGTALAPGVTVDADETASVRSVAVAASIAAAICIGGALSGAGTSARNTIASKVNASIEGASGLTSAYGIHIHADNTSDLTSTDRPAALAGGLAACAGAVTLSNNTLQDTVTASIASSSSVVATAGDVTVEASSKPTMRTVAVTVGVPPASPRAVVVVTAEETSRATSRPRSTRRR